MIIRYQTMGNNLQALNTAKTISKQLLANKEHLPKPKDIQNETNLPKNRANSEPARSEYGVTSLNQTSSTQGSGYPKESSQGMSAMNVDTSPSSGVMTNMDNTSQNSSFVYYGSAKPNPAMQDYRETTPKNHSVETSRTARKVDDSRLENHSGSEKKRTPVVVDLTIGDSDDDDEDTSSCSGNNIVTQDSSNTFPKILAAYSLNSKHSSFPAAELCTLLSQQAKENVVKENAKALNGSSDVNPKAPNTALPYLSEFLAKKGINGESKNDITGISTNNELISDPIALFRNDVMNDVTNLRNRDYLSSTKIPEHKQLFANWGVRDDVNVESSRDQSVEDSDSSDQVIITKVVKVSSTDKSRERKHHPRKAPIQVRKLFFDDKSGSTGGRDASNSNTKNDVGKDEPEEWADGSSVQEPASFNGNIYGTPWSFTISPDDSTPFTYRENKIQSLKDRLAKQQEALEKLRTKEKQHLSSSQLNGIDRVLVVQIPDLKAKLAIHSEKKQSFRIIEQREGSSNKRKRKTVPRKVTRDSEARFYSDNNTNKSHLPSKRTRSRIERGAIKPKLPKRPRGRSSPVVEKLVPVVSKDLWHREMEKVEAELESSNRAIDQTSFLLFLGLRKVQACC